MKPLPHKRSTRIAAVFFLAVVLGAGCAEEQWSVEPPQPDMLTLSFSGLEDLGSEYAYEGWLVVEGLPISTGTFTVDEGGNISPSEFHIDPANLSAATEFILTIEPSPDADPGPSRTRYLAGDFASDARLTVDHLDALRSNFLSAAGSYLLETPTTADDPDDYGQGIWFAIPSVEPPWGALLQLPAIPRGWIYEGWVIGPEGPISTGKFDATGYPDRDGAGPAAGPDQAPQYPGQDFIDPPISLFGYQVAVSIEPDPDNDPGPFTLQPLIALEMEDFEMGMPQPMTNNAGSFPTGMAGR
jgi:hypothetical protein